MRGPAFPVILLAMACCAPAGAAEVYRWVDDNGRVHYTDRVPDGAEAPRAIELGEPPQSGDDAGERRLKQRRLLEAFEAERTERAQAQEQARAEARRREARCDHARRELAAVERANLVYSKDESGERRYLSDAERGRAIAQTRAWIAKWCR